MNRRDFLRILLSSAIAEAVDVEQLLWVPKPIVTVPERVIAVDWGRIDQSWYGIPYHEYLGSTGTWMGITRSEVPAFARWAQEQRNRK